MRPKLRCVQFSHYAVGRTALIFKKSTFHVLLEIYTGDGIDKWCRISGICITHCRLQTIVVSIPALLLLWTQLFLDKHPFKINVNWSEFVSCPPSHYLLIQVTLSKSLRGEYRKMSDEILAPQRTEADETRCKIPQRLMSHIIFHISLH